MRARRAIAALAALPLSVAAMGVAHADNLVNDVNVAAGDDTIASGGSTTIGYKINGNGGDGQNGCNASDGSPAVVTLGVPPGVSASQPSLTFTACNVFQNVTFSSAVAGNYAITVTSINDSGVGAYANQANWTLHVLSSDSTGPVITPAVTGTLGDNGWYTSNVAVSWTVVDAESTITSRTGCVDQTISTDQQSTTYSCSATSAGGTSSRSVSVKRDATAPVVSPLDVNALAWRNTSLGQAFTASDATSGLASSTDAGFSLTASDQSAGTSAPTTVTRTVKDAAGNSTTRSLSAFIDYDAPVISGADIADPVWRNTDLTGSFTASDALSGLASSSDASFDLTASAQSADDHTPTVVSRTVTDKAGNSSPRSVSAFIDRTDPSISGDDIEDTTWRKTPLSAHFTAEDTLSGLFDLTDSSFDLTATAESADASTPTVVSKTVKDRAGNDDTRSVSAFIDLSEPDISGSDEADSTWRNGSFSRSFTASDRLSGLADASDASFTLTVDGESSNASTPATASRTVYDVVGHSSTRTISAMIDTTKPWISGPDVIDGHWRNTSLTEDFTAGDALSGLADGEEASFSLTASEESKDASTPTVVTRTVTDKAGNERTRIVSALIDKSDPVVSPGSVDDKQWRNTPLSQTFTASDGRSGLANQGDASFELTASDESMDALHPTVVRHTVSDVAGNTTERTVSALIDTTRPTNVTFSGISAGTYYAKTLPAMGAIDCDAVDVLSGMDGCTISGYSGSTGSHTLIATATDKAGNQQTATLTYTVRELAYSGFYSPVDMGATWNTIKGGNTVPLKFEVFDVSSTGARTELTDKALVAGFSWNKVNCTTGSEDAIETMATAGQTELRYDLTGGQFIQNWKTPTGSGCYRATATLVDGNTISALFKTLK